MLSANTSPTDHGAGGELGAAEGGGALGVSWRSLAAIEVLLVFAVFFFQGAWPAPDVNEPHYLSKAKAYWDPDWIAGDFFLDSADAHLAFYWSLGWLTLWMPLRAFAWCGRLLTWLLMAWAWRRLSVALVPRPLLAVLSAAVFVTLSEYGHMAGEWVVGGLEAKGFAYVLVFLALERLVCKRWNTALLLLGAASAFHVLVGGWTVVAVAIAWLLQGRDRPPLQSLSRGLTGGLALSLLGLVPGVALSLGVDAGTREAANVIYVFHRLRHHLEPGGMNGWFITRHAGLLIVWVALYRALAHDEKWRRLGGVVLGVVAIAVAGFVLAGVFYPFRPTAAALLRFYWFRASDALLPLGTAMFFVGAIAQWKVTRPQLAVYAMSLAVLFSALHLGHLTWQRWEDDTPRADGPTHVADFDDWLDICAAVRRETPREALLLTPRMAETFKWCAARREVVNQKDIPQDAEGILLWWNRMRRVHKIEQSPAPRSLASQGTAEVRRLSDEFGADFVLTLAQPRLALPVVARNNSYVLYEVSGATTP